VCRYTYKGLGKSAKKEVTEAAKSGDAAWLKSAKSKVRSRHLLFFNASLE
jgi:hypothetical protein